MDSFNKLKGHVSNFMGGSGNKPPPDDLMVSCQQQLKDLQEEIVQVKKQFTQYAHQVVEAAEASVTLSKSVGNFYSHANHPGRTESVKLGLNRMESIHTYQKVQEDIANRAVNTFHITVENGLIAELTEWNSLVQKHLEDIQVADQTRTTAHDTANRLHSLQNEYTEKKNKKSKTQSLFGGNREQELEDLQERISKASEVRKSLSAEYQTQKNRIAQSVKQLMEKRYIYFDRIYVQMLECQAEYFDHAAKISKRFQRDIDYYRKQYPKQHEFQYSNGTNGATSSSAKRSSVKSEPFGSALNAKGGKKSSKSKPIVDFGGTNSPLQKPKVPSSEPPAAPQHHYSQLNGAGSGSSGTSSSSSSPMPQPNLNGHLKTASTGNGMNNGSSTKLSAKSKGIQKSASVGGTVDDTLSSSAVSIEAPRHDQQQRQPSMHEHDFFGDFGASSNTSPNQTSSKPSHNKREDSILTSLGYGASESRIEDDHGIFGIADPNNADMLFSDVGFGGSGSGGGNVSSHNNNGSNNNQQQNVNTSNDDFFSGFGSSNNHNNNKSEGRMSAPNSAPHSDLYGFLSESKPVSKPQQSNGRPTSQSVHVHSSHSHSSHTCPNMGGLASSQSNTTPPNGAQQNDDSKQQASDLQLGKRGKENAHKAWKEKMKLLQEQEEQEEEKRLERERWKDTHESKLNAWEYDESTTRRNVMTLISRLPDVLPAEVANHPKSNWKPIPITKLLNDSQLKRGYFKAIRVVHPDKSSQRGDSIEAQVICDHVFQALERAYKTQFN